jgi:uncharacterized protein
MEKISATESENSDLAGGNSAPIRALIAAFVLARIFDSYHLLIAPFLSAHSGSSCRFEPSCSRYARTALLRFGVCRGGYLTLRRLTRCHPFGSHGYDPVPELGGQFR